MLPQPRLPTRIEPDGLTQLPAGKIAAVATYLEMRAPPPAGQPGAAEGRFEALAGQLPRYRALYRDVGEPWLWFSRAVMPDPRLSAIIDHPDVEALAFVCEGRDAGIVELDFREGRQCELAFLGLAEAFLGRGLGGGLIGEAVRRAFARPIDRLWLHTCTLDHPAALGFYIQAGFTPYRRAIEIAEDPRLTGQLSRDAAPRWPVI